MNYKYCQNRNFEDFASGRVIIHKSGFSNFPARLAQEIYCRCMSYIKNKSEICIYDPCCGGGYLLTILGFLNSDSLKTIICSDFDTEALNITRQNLELLTHEGLEKRLSHLQNLYAQYKKESHLQAIESAITLGNYLKRYKHIPDTNIFQANILSSGILNNKSFKADIVMTDIPYGNLTTWKECEGTSTENFPDNLAPILKPDAVIAICSNKHQAIPTNMYARIEKQQIGKRKFELLTLR